METFEIPLDESRDEETVLKTLAAACEGEGLETTLDSTLNTYPGSTHWHLKKPGERGTLEFTYWPKKGRAWFAVHARRNADWIPSAIERIIARTEFLIRASEP